MKLNSPIYSGVREILEAKDEDTYIKILRGINSFTCLDIFERAYDHIEKLPLSELPKYINHPCSGIQRIVNRRLSG